MMKTKTIAKGKCFGSPARQRDSLVILGCFFYCGLDSPIQGGDVEGSLSFQGHGFDIIVLKGSPKSWLGSVVALLSR